MLSKQVACKGIWFLKGKSKNSILNRLMTSNVRRSKKRLIKMATVKLIWWHVLQAGDVKRQSPTIWTRTG